MWIVLLMIILSTFIYAQSSNWNADDDMSQEELVEFCDNQGGQEYREVKDYNGTFYIICERWWANDMIRSQERFPQSDANTNNLYECNRDQQQELFKGGVFWDAFRCYPERGNFTNNVECGSFFDRGQWEEVRL